MPSIRLFLSIMTALAFSLLSFTAQAQWFSSSNGEGEFLPVQEAFQPSTWHDGETLYIGMEIAENYYLYRHQFKVQSVDAGSDGSVKLGTPQLPEGIFTTDEFMGEVSVFRDRMVFEVPLESPYSGSFPFTLTFQGCAAMAPTRCCRASR